MMTDPIADMLTRIRNASAIKKHDTSMPLSRVKFEIAKILQKEGYLVNVEKTEGPKATLKLTLRYGAQGPAVRDILRVSKPGRRVYAPKTALPRVLNDIGIAIVSTSSGLMTNKEARKRGLGGEIVCEVY